MELHNLAPQSLYQPSAGIPQPAGRKLRIALLCPRGPLYRHRGGIWKKTMRYAPLTLTTLASLVPPEIPAGITLLDEGVDEIASGKLEADLVGITAITGTAPRAYELAREFRARGIPVVLGGVHPTLMPQEAIQHADSIVVGYAEESWPQLLRDFVAGRMQRRYDQSPQLKLDNLPFPRRDLYKTGMVNVADTIEATRGCIFQCDFCVVPSAWGTRPLQKPVGDVIADLRQLGARRAIFLDLNLIANLPYARELFTAMIPLNLRWAGLVTTTIAWDEELLDLAARSGCRGLLIGFESLDQKALDESKKGFNMRQDYRLVVDRIHDRGIAIMGCFVFGFDADTLETFDRTVDFVMESRMDLPRYAIAVPFPATGLYRRLKAENRILTDDWSLYDGQHVVFEPANMSPDQLLRHTGRAWKKTYEYKSIARRVLGSGTRMLVSGAANLGYRFYANNLDKFYTCDWQLALRS